MTPENLLKLTGSVITLVCLVIILICLIRNHLETERFMTALEERLK
jgi:hypothetical protein